MRSAIHSVAVGSISLLVLLGGCRWDAQDTPFSNAAAGSRDEEAAGVGDDRATGPEVTVLRTGDYPDNGIAATKPVVFAPGFISTGGNERDAALSPDGKVFLFSLGSPSGATFDIIEVRKEGGRWQRPHVAPFSSRSADIEPFFAPADDAVYFASNRPGGPHDDSEDWNLWKVDREGNGWGEPSLVGGFPHSEADEFYPCITRSGALYFTAALEGGFGGEDLYRAPFADGAFGEAENLGGAINSASDEFNAWVDPEEKFIIFSSYGREDGLGGGDLYISYRDEGGEWKAAVNMGESVNSPALDYCPSISPDGKYFFFSSRRTTGTSGPRRDYDELMAKYRTVENGLGDIYWVDATFLWEGIR